MVRSRFPGRLVATLSVTIAALAACADDGSEPIVTGSEPDETFVLSSPAFDGGGTIPDRYSCRGDDVSPPLAWSDPPPGTVSFAVVMDDPDAVPVAGFVWDHWVLWALPADARSLPEAVPTETAVAGGGTQGENSFGRIGYGGPCPPPGQSHTYVFRAYALDTEPEPEGVTKADLLDALDGHVLAEATLTATFTR